MFLSLVLPLFGCDSFHTEIKGKIPYDDQYHEVCEVGDLDIHDDVSGAIYGVNVLPLGYYGSYPDTGILEIGNRAGDENGRLCPVMDFNIVKRNTTILFSVMFESNPLNFPSNVIRKKLGYEICYLDVNGNEQFINHYNQAERLSEVYSRTSLPGYHFDDSYSKITSFIYEPKNALCLTINFMKKEKLKYIRFVYGDVPMNYLNVAATLSRSNLDEDIPKKYDGGNDCNRYDYKKKLGSDVEYELTSQYGYCYSRNYLLSLFIVKDENDNTQDHITTIEDPDNYFTTGRYAPLGSRYDLFIKHTNSLGNTSTLTLHLTVKDKSAPLIEKKNEEEIRVSYAQKFDSSFILKHFDVTDNYDESVSLELLDTYGNPLKAEVGKTTVTLSAKDTSGNVSKYPFVLERFDDVPPVIEAENDEVILTTDKVLTSASLLSMFSVHDEIDGDIAPSIEENTYSSNCHDVGEYVFSVSATDKSGNKNVKSIRILVQEADKPVFYAKESFFTFIEGEIPSEEQILSSLVRNHVLEDKNYIRMEYLSGDEISSSLREGNYESTVNCVADDGTSTMVSLSIEVVRKNIGLQDVAEDETTKAEDVEESFWERIGRWFRELFESLWDMICFWK